MKNVSSAIIYVMILGYFLNLLVRERLTERERVLEMLFGLVCDGDRLRVGGRERLGVGDRLRVGGRERVRLGVGVGDRDRLRGGIVGVFVIEGLGDAVCD
jgi:hypothetical protein